MNTMSKDEVQDILRRAPGNNVRRQVTEEGHLCYTSLSLVLKGEKSE